MTRRTLRASALCAVLSLATLSLGPGAVAAGEEQAAPAAAISLKFGMYIGDEKQPTTSHLAKLNSDVAFPPGTLDGVLSDNRLTGSLVIPGTTGYFVAFRFMPTTGAVTLVPDGDVTGTALVKTGEDETGKGLRAVTDVTAKVFVKLGDVKVDGRRLDVGPNCGTVQSAAVNIKATLPLVIPPEGQPRPATKVTAVFTAPPFAGCGVTEDLSPLLTGLVSGPGNTLVTNVILRCVGSGPPPKGCGP